jgi:TolA-binding protein
MKREARLLDHEVEAVIERGRQVRQAPDVVRARLMARARAAFAASKTAPAPIPGLSSAGPWQGRRIAVAASVLLVFATAGAAAALHARVAPAAATAPPPPRVPEAPSVRPAAAGLPAVQPAGPASNARTQRPRRSITPQESYAAELELLQRAQSEYASRDFADALVLVAEHGRRFPNGRLAEEREEVRVRSLARAGRGDQARRALASFAKRFPHSVLLPRLQEAARSADD